MGRAGGQQPHAHNVFLFRRPLAQFRQVFIALAPIAGNAVNEDHQQAAIEHETDHHPFDVETEQPLGVIQRHG